MKPMCTIAVGISVRITSSNFFLRTSRTWTADSPRVSLPVHAIDAADLEVLQQAPREQAALTSRDSGDEDLFHRDSEDLRDQLNGCAGTAIRLHRNPSGRGIN